MVCRSLGFQLHGRHRELNMAHPPLREQNLRRDAQSRAVFAFFFPHHGARIITRRAAQREDLIDDIVVVWVTSARRFPDKTAADVRYSNRR